ncbi:glycoprotein-N-acetylgalactosamine 3-beta-galactosyltransferase 1-like [Daphnia carinata]|uniref:glycoprotein-N-acetylgalactosamine 3-beta-galactosyltransferase 1-like n=1 Tax=Daphnia carinata TaxID=120202 RepID=UPI00257DE1A9|nr:glycoprotein-N-acetylgalactosamine 3-beta-galactosyltransferase 1-like [Daphnia carinata]
MEMFRLPVRRLSFFSLLVGAIFGCFLNSLVQESVQQLFLNDHLVPVSGVDQEPESSVQQGTETSEKDVTVRAREEEDVKGNNEKGLYDKVRVLCWVMTSPANHETKALAVKETWGKRCNVLLFMSTEADTNLPAVQLDLEEGRNRLWGKTREAFRYAWDRFQDEVDWFFKADDDTYVVVENLRYFLSAFKTSEPFWFGHKYKTNVTAGFFSGDAGYALSKEATKRFVKDGYFNPLLCRKDPEGAEDVELGKCMENLNVSAMDTRDSKGRGRFFPFQPDRFYFSRKITDYWYWKFIYYPPIMGSDCCSDSTISFHYIDPKLMRLLDFFFYQIRPFGIVDQRPATPEPPPVINLTATPWFAPNDTLIIAGIPMPRQTTTEGTIGFAEDAQQTIKQSSDYSRYQINSSGMVDQRPIMFKVEEPIRTLLTTRRTNMEPSFITKAIVDQVTMKARTKRFDPDEDSAVLEVKIRTTCFLDVEIFHELLQPGLDSLQRQQR